MRMQGEALVTPSGARPPPRVSSVRAGLVVVAAFAGPPFAQSFLGTIRGTVVDPQGAAVQDAAVLIVDESTGVPRTAATDSEGRYEASNLKPGTYRVEVVTPNFKKAEQTGIVLRASGIARADVKLELGALTETVTVSAETTADITIESQAVASGLDAQPLHNLVPRRPHLRRLLRAGRPGLDQRDLRHDRQLGPGARCDRGDDRPLQLLQRGVRRAGRRRGAHTAR